MTTSKMVPKTTAGTANLTSTKRRPIKPWDKDGVNGGPSSLSAVMAWITKPANFSRWEGSEDSNSCTRESLCSEINRQLMKHGITHRNNRDIRNRLQNLFYGFKKTQNWIKDNERDSRNKLADKGVPVEQIDLIIRDKVKGMFSYYYILEPLINAKRTTNADQSNSSNTVSDADRVHDVKEDPSDQASSPSLSPSLSPSSSSTRTTPSISTPKPTVLLASLPSPVDQTTVKTSKTNTSNKSIKRIGRDHHSRKRARRGIKRHTVYSVLTSFLENKAEIEKRQLDIEERRARMEEQQLEASLLQKKAEAQTAFIQAWKSVGFTNEQIIVKINEIWKDD